jgi:ribonuclease HI
MKTVTVYTDGACSGNPGPGGWAAVLTCDEHARELTGGEPETTNNRMELQAIVAALGAIKRPCEITLYSDSKYALGALTGNKAKANRDLVGEAQLQLSRITKMGGIVRFEHVNGHSGSPLNERCDRLAKAQAAQIKGQ